MQVDKSPFSGANNYDWLLNHDLPGILDNRFELGDFTDAQNLLLVGRISEDPTFNEVGANWYWDGVWRTPVAWAQYLEGTNDVAFVKQYFHDDANGPSQWGPSLYTMMHTDFLSQLNPQTELPQVFLRQRLRRQLAVRRRDGASRPVCLRIHRDADRQHGRSARGRRAPTPAC